MYHPAKTVRIIPIAHHERIFCFVELEIFFNLWSHGGIVKRWRKNVLALSRTLRYIGFMTDGTSDISQRGHVYFWKFKTDGWLGSEWHLSTDRTGRIFMLELMDRWRRETRIRRCRLDISPVSRPVARLPGLDLPTENRQHLKLTYDPADASYDAWSIQDNEQTVDVQFGRTILAMWRKALTALPDDDRSVGIGEDHTIFVW